MTDEQVILTFYKGKDGRTIARTTQGKICLLDIPYCKENKIWVNEWEDWKCGIKINKENVLIVQPINRLLTAEENKELFEIKAKELQKEGFKTEKKKYKPFKKKVPTDG